MRSLALKFQSGGRGPRGWNDHYLLTQERAFEERVEKGDWSPRHQSLLLVAGGCETPQDIQEAQALERRLQRLSRWGVRSAFHLQAEEDHNRASRASAGVNRAKQIEEGQAGASRSHASRITTTHCPARTGDPG